MYCPSCGGKLNKQYIFEKEETATNDVFSNALFRVITTECAQFEDGEREYEENNPWPLIENGLVYQQQRYTYASSYLDLTGSEIQLETQYDSKVFKQTRLLVGRGFKVITDKTKFDIPFSFTFDYFKQHEMLLMVERDGLYGFVNAKGKDVIPCDYIRATPFQYGFTIVSRRVGHKVEDGCLDVRNRTIVPFIKTTSIRIVSEDIIQVDYDDPHPYHRLYSSNGRVVMEGDSIEEVNYLGCGYYGVRFLDADRIYRYNKETDTFLLLHIPNILNNTPDYYPFENGFMYIPNANHSLYGIWLDKFGNVHKVSYYDTNRRHSISLEGEIIIRRGIKLWTCWNLWQNRGIDYQGEYKHFFGKSFSEGLVPFMLDNGRTGYLNRSGRIEFYTQTPCVMMCDFKNGVAPVKIAGKGWCIIDKRGEYVLPPIYKWISYCDRSRAYLCEIITDYSSSFRGGAQHLLFRKTDYEKYLDGFTVGSVIPDDFKFVILPNLSNEIRFTARIGEISYKSLISILNKRKEDDVVEMNSWARFLFESIQDELSLCYAINTVANNMLHLEAQPFTAAEINKLADFENHERYHFFRIPKKKRNQFREISSPNDRLKVALRCLNVLVASVYCPNNYVTGFTKGSSIVANASRHLSKKYTFAIDLARFFDHISCEMVIDRLVKSPYNLLPEVANVIVRMSSIKTDMPGKQSKLAQGSPLSPILANISCETMDCKLNELSNVLGASYSRYADDITISSDRNLFPKGSENRFLVQQIIEDNGYKINCNKIRVQNYRSRQLVTGIVVNEKLNVPVEYVKDIRNLLFIWDKYGAEAAYLSFYRKFIKVKEKRNHKVPFFIDYLKGKVEFIKFVKGPQDPIYVRLNNHLNKLTTSSFSPFFRKAFIRGRDMSLSKGGGRFFINYEYDWEEFYISTDLKPVIDELFENNAALLQYIDNQCIWVRKFGNDGVKLMLVKNMFPRTNKT